MFRRRKERNASHPGFRWLNLVAKATLVGLLMLGVVAAEWAQFQGKAMLPRALTYPLAALLVPVWWRLRGRPAPYPHTLDLLVVLPFLIDTAGNALNLYNTTEFFDRVAHWLNWAILVAAFGATMSALGLGRLNVFALAVGFGTTTHVCWEVIEYVLMQLGAGGLQLTYADTIEDLVLSTLGSLAGGWAAVTVLWDHRIVPRQMLRGDRTQR